MRCLLLFIMLPLLAASELTDKQREIVEYVEKQYGPCIRHGINCPPDNSLEYPKIAEMVEIYRNHYSEMLPSECNCDESVEMCNRECYLAILKKMYAGNVKSSKRSTGELTDKQREMMEYVEKQYGPCILHGINCPPDNSLDYPKIAEIVEIQRKFYPKLLPSECNCDKSVEMCNRKCYLAILKKMYADSVKSSKRSTDELTDKQREMMEYVEKQYGPCILHGTNCPDNSFDYAKIAEMVEIQRKFYPKMLPSECNCDESVEMCNRKCYLAILKKMYADNARKM